MGDGGSRYREMDTPGHRRSRGCGGSLPARQAVSNGGISNRRTIRSASTRDEIQPGGESLLIVYVVVVQEPHESTRDMPGFIEKVRVFSDEDAAHDYALDQVDEGNFPSEFGVEVEGTEEGVRA